MNTPKARSYLSRRGSVSSVVALLLLLTAATRSTSAPLNYAGPNKRSLVDARSEVRETLQLQNDNKFRPTLESLRRALVEIGSWRVENGCRIDSPKISENSAGQAAASGCGTVLYSYRRDLFRPSLVLHERFVGVPRRDASAPLSSQEMARPVDEFPFFRLSRDGGTIDPMRLYGFVTRLYGRIQSTFKRSSTSPKIYDRVSRGLPP
jgi:hypothetical protein